MSKESESNGNVQKTAKDLADLIARFISFSELEKLIHNLFSTKEMFELVDFISNAILEHFFSKPTE